MNFNITQLEEIRHNYIYIFHNWKQDPACCLCSLIKGMQIIQSNYFLKCQYSHLPAFDIN